MPSPAEPVKLPIPPIRILGDRVWVIADKRPDKIGSIIIPDTANPHGDRELLTGRVVAVGPGMICADGSRFPMADVKIGDKVAFIKYGTDERVIEDVKYLSMRDDNIQAVLEDE